MSLFFRSLSSGSSGNSYLIWSETTTLLIDSGIAAKNIISGLEETQKVPDDLAGILVTHEHSDHIKSLHTIHKLIEHTKIYASKGTLGYLIEDGRYSRDALTEIAAGKGFVIGDVEIEPFSLSHDAAEPLGYSLSNHGSRITIITDTGHVTPEQMDVAMRSTLLVLESNHEKNILMANDKYSYELKRRIAGDSGHISNEDAAACVAEILRKRKNRDMPHIVLAHLSKENNTPYMAEVTVKNLLFEDGFIEGSDYKLSVAKRDELGPVITA